MHPFVLLPAFKQGPLGNCMLEWVIYWPLQDELFGHIKLGCTK